MIGRMRIGRLMKESNAQKRGRLAAGEEAQPLKRVFTISARPRPHFERLQAVSLRKLHAVSARGESCIRATERGREEMRLKFLAVADQQRTHPLTGLRFVWGGGVGGRKDFREGEKGKGNRRKSVHPSGERSLRVL